MRLKLERHLSLQDKSRSTIHPSRADFTSINSTT